MPEEYKTDGWINFAGGMRLSDGARSAVGSDQAEIIVNATVRQGRADPRPAYRRVDVGFSENAQLAFERGIVQGSAYYDGPNGGRWVYIADGRILSFDPVNRFVTDVSPGGDRVFHPLAQHCHLEQRGRWMVCQDGINPPVYLEGESGTVNDDAFNGIPTGRMMADGWHRLVVSSSNGRRLYISDHEFDPFTGDRLATPKPLQFTDDATYFGNARYFEIPRALGEIKAVTFAPSFNNQDDWGPLLVFCQHGTRAYQMQVPREDWANADISATLLPTVGASAHGSIVPRGNDVVFSDQDGRIQTFKQAVSSRDDVRLRPADQAVYQLYRGEERRYRSHRKAARFDDRILFTVWPEPVSLAAGRRTVRHRGFVVMEEDHLSDQPFVWAGLWTGIYPVAINSGGVRAGAGESPEEKCFAVSLDPDGLNRIYEITREPGPDLAPEPRRVPMWIVPRWMDYQSPMRRKSIQAAALQLADMKGRVTIQGWWQSASKLNPQEWFTHHEAAAHCFQYRDGRIVRPAESGIPRLNLPGPDDTLDFYRARPWLRINGQASVEEGIFESAIDSSSPQSNVSCIEPESAAFRSAECAPHFWEPHLQETPIEPHLTHEVCDG